MLGALQAAGLEPGSIDYINLHGTGTLSNDNAEGHAVASVFGQATPSSSTKGATGHALGAAGALEAVICCLALQNGLAPRGINTRKVDSGLGIRYLLENHSSPLLHALSNSFGFGGTNCSLIFGRAG
jgi:3-oxoacyl-[acyl-carrier-protein] synthase-1